MKKHLIFYILVLSAFSIQADGVNLTCSPYQSCVNCPEYQTLFPIQQLSSDLSSIEVEADQSEITQNNVYLLSGNVKLKSGDYLLSADEVEFSGSDQSTIAEGNIEYQDTEYLIAGDNISAKKENDQITAIINNARYQEIKNNANGTAELITKNGDIVVFKKATYSYCPINQNDWYVYANKIRANFDTNRGLADNAILIFKGFPIFYLPSDLYRELRGAAPMTLEQELYLQADDTEAYLEDIADRRKVRRNWWAPWRKSASPLTLNEELILDKLERAAREGKIIPAPLLKKESGESVDDGEPWYAYFNIEKKEEAPLILLNEQRQNSMELIRRNLN